MAQKRLPRPDKPCRIRLEVSPDELTAAEDLAHECRLSVASFSRALVVAAVENREAVLPLVGKTASRLMGETTKAKPGRPRKDAGDKPKKGKGADK